MFDLDTFIADCRAASAADFGPVANLYGPAARRKTDFQDDEREVLHQQ